MAQCKSWVKCKIKRDFSGSIGQYHRLLEIILVCTWFVLFSSNRLVSRSDQMVISDHGQMWHVQYLYYTTRHVRMKGFKCKDDGLLNINSLHRLHMFIMGWSSMIRTNVPAPEWRQWRHCKNRTKRANGQTSQLSHRKCYRWFIHWGTKWDTRPMNLSSSPSSPHPPSSSLATALANTEGGHGPPSQILPQALRKLVQTLKFFHMLK